MPLPIPCTCLARRARNPKRTQRQRPLLVCCSVRSQFLLTLLQRVLQIGRGLVVVSRVQSRQSRVVGVSGFRAPGFYGLIQIVGAETELLGDSFEVRFGILWRGLLVGALGSIRLVDLLHRRFQDCAALLTLHGRHSERPPTPRSCLTRSRTRELGSESPRARPSPSLCRKETSQSAERPSSSPWFVALT